MEPRRGGAVLYGLAFAHLDYSQEVLSALTLGFAAGAAILRAFVVPAWWYESARVNVFETPRSIIY
jgi:hypothetical protein